MPDNLFACFNTAIPGEYMKIAVNTRLLLKDRLDGIGNFSDQSLRRITQQHPEVEFLFLFDRPWHQDFIYSSNVQPLSLFPQARHPLLYHIWFNLSVPTVLHTHKPDLFFSPDGYLPLSGVTKSVAVFHDLNFEHFPKDHFPAERYYYRTFFPKFATRATRIGTVSEFSRQDIIKTYGVAPEKIDVLYNGVSDAFRPVNANIVKTVQQKYSDGKPFFLYVGAINPRKNLANLVRAYGAFRDHYDGRINLVVAGPDMHRDLAFAEALNRSNYRQDIILTGRLSPTELASVMGSALALTYVSYFEGFGIPIIEAFSCDTPVITSNVSAMPEVATDAALLVDPFDVQGIAQAMHSIAKDEVLRHQLIAKGRLRVRDFSWQQTADRLWNTMLRALE